MKICMKLSNSLFLSENQIIELAKQFPETRKFRDSEI